MSKFLAFGWDSPAPFLGTVSVWVLILPRKPQPSIFFLCLQALRNLSSPAHSPQADDSNMLQMFNINTYADFRTVKKHVLIPSYVIQVI